LPAQTDDLVIPRMGQGLDVAPGCAKEAFPMFVSQAIGFVSSPYKKTGEIPKGLGAKHEVDGVLRILAEFEPGLADIEGFSHLIVLWEFDRSEGFQLLGTPPSDNRPHGVFATRSPRRPNPIGLTIVELQLRDGCELHVRGVDMLDGTPILDIKPLLSGVPVEKLRRGWLAEAEARAVRPSKGRRDMGHPAVGNS
jgi:tRNA (adenine37-N6)-methyltransferase